MGESQNQGTNFNSFIIILAMIFLGLSVLGNLSQFNLIRVIPDVMILIGYFLLFQEQKLGFLLMWLGWLFMAILALLLRGPDYMIMMLFSAEFLLNIVVTATVANKFKTMNM